MRQKKAEQDQWPPEVTEKIFSWPIEACRVCGWDVRAGADFCRACDAAYEDAMRKAKRPIRRSVRVPTPKPIEIDDSMELPF